MSAPREVSVWGPGFGEGGGEQAGVCSVGPGAPRGPPGLGVDLGPPPSRDDEGGVADPEGFESEREVTEAGEPVFWGLEGRPGSPTDDKGDALDGASHLADEAAAAIVQQLNNRDGLGVRRNPCPESCVVVAGLEAGPSRGGALALSRGESQPPDAAPLHLGGPEGGPAWASPKRGKKSRSNVAASGDHQGPSAESPGELPFDIESSDEFREIQLRRLSIYTKGGGPVKPNSAEDPGNTPRHSNFHVRENFLHVPGSFPSSAPRGLASVVERQAVGELDISSRKMQSVVGGKGENRPSYPKAAGAGGLPRAAPKKKVAKEKISLAGAPTAALGEMFPSWGQRVSVAPLEPATFPPITAVPLLGRSKRYSLVPLGTKQSKHTPAGKKSVARRARKAELPVAGEDNGSNRDTVPKLSAHGPGPSCPFLHRGESSRGDLNPRALQFPGSSQTLAPSRGDVMPRGPTPSGDQEALAHPPRPERQQQPPGAQGCPGCLVLQREIDDLKERLAALQSLTDQSQTL